MRDFKLTLHVCELNIKGISRAKTEYLSKLADENIIQVLVLQETHAKNDDDLWKRSVIYRFNLPGAVHSQIYRIATHVR